MVDCHHCRNLFAEQMENSQKARRINQEHPNFECEQCQVSAHSPGAVGASERLVRFVLDSHMKDGRLDPLQACNGIDKKGMSVQRLEHCSVTDLVRHGECLRHKAEGRSMKSRRLEGAFVLEAGDVRSLKSVEAERLFGVYDTATEDSSAHADILLACSSNRRPDRQEARDRIMKLYETGKGVVPIESIIETADFSSTET